MSIRNKNVTYGDEMSISVNGKDIMQPEHLKPLGVTLVYMLVIYSRKPEHWIDHEVEESYAN